MKIFHGAAGVCAFAVAVMLPAHYGLSQERPTIFVKQLVAGRGVSATEAAQASRALEAAVVESGRYRVMGQSQYEQLLETLGKQQFWGCNTEACLKEIMRTTQTEYLVYGEISKDGGEYAVAANLMHRHKKTGVAEVAGASTQFATGLGTRLLTLLAGNIVRQLHNEKVTQTAVETVAGGDTDEFVRFRVTSYPAGAELFINGKKIGATPVTRQYPVASYGAELRYPHFKRHQFTITLPGTKEYNVRMERERYRLSLAPERGAPDGIKITESGSELGTLGRGGLALTLDFGEHMLTFEKRGYDAKTVTVDMKGNRSLPVRLSRSRHTLEVSASVPGADVYIDSVKKGKAPYRGTHDFGKYTVEVKKSGYLEERQAVALEGDRKLEFVLRERKFCPFRVESDPPSAEVHFGWKKQGVTPGTFQWPEGDEIEVKVVYDDLERVKTVKLANPNRTENVRFDFGLVPFRVESDPPGAEVFFGGTKRGIAPCEFTRPVGELELTARCGEFTLTRTVKLAGKTRPGTVRFDFGYVPFTLDSKPSGAEVSFGGKPRGKTPGEFVWKAGIAQVTLTHEGKSVTQSLDIAREARLSIDMTEPKAGTVKRIGGMEFVYIPAGSFMMGSPPGHRVSLDGFWMGKYEVTQGQYEEIMGNNPSYFKGWFKGTHPVEQVSWYNAQDFCVRFAEKHKVAAKLPSEAEWEYAVRAGSATAYYWGDRIDGRYLWYWDNSNKITHRVGEKLPNGWGLYDMSGNVWEWCADWYDEGYYAKSPERNPRGPESGQSRVVRGGSWLNGGAIFGRSNVRFKDYPNSRVRHYGFRMVLPSAGK